MKTVTEISRLTGVSVRTLHHYDAIGLLKPTAVTEAGYRLYDGRALERLYLILVYREIGFSLKEVGALLDAPDEERNRILSRQVAQMQDKVTKLQNRIHFAGGIQLTGVKHMNWNGFDPKKIDDYSRQAEGLYGKTEAWQEYKQKSAGRSDTREQALGDELMALFTELGAMKQLAPESEKVQAWVTTLQAFITDHYYRCTPQIPKGLGQMYAGGGSMTENIDRAGGPGTGEFALRAIEVYCGE